MPSPNKSQVHKKTRNNKPRKCGDCCQKGHDRRNCPVNPRLARQQWAQEVVVLRTAVEGGPPKPLFMPTVAQKVSTIYWESFYMLFLIWRQDGGVDGSTKLLRLRRRFWTYSCYNITSSHYGHTTRHNK
jgi:hypothetical protein